MNIHEHKHKMQCILQATYHNAGAGLDNNGKRKTLFTAGENNNNITYGTGLNPAVTHSLW